MEIIDEKKILSMKGGKKKNTFYKLYAKGVFKYLVCFRII